VLVVFFDHRSDVFVVVFACRGGEIHLFTLNINTVFFIKPKKIVIFYVIKFSISFDATFTAN